MNMARERKTILRYEVVIGAALIEICLGAFHAWPVPAPKLCDSAGSYAFTAEQVRLIFSAGLLALVLGATAAGPLMRLINPARTAVAGGILLSAGYLSAAFGETFIVCLIGIGVIGGLGTGLAYMVPIAVGIKWFPDKKGMVTGLATAGFGLGALVWTHPAGSSDLFGRLGLFGLDGIGSVFFLFGVGFLIVIAAGSLLMADPPLGWSPPGWTLSPSEEASGAVDFGPGEMIRTPQFMGLWIAFLISATAGLTVIENMEFFGIRALSASGLERGLAVEAAGWAAASLVILNGLGRIAWGIISDITGRRQALFFLFLIQSGIMMISYRMGHDPKWLILAACVIGLNFGGSFALFPVITADLFGNRSVGHNYGFVLAAYGIAGIAGPAIAFYVRRAATSDAAMSGWVWPFVIAGAGCLLSAAIVFYCRSPKKKS